MGKDSGIEWTEHTFNPWWGCTKVSRGCTYCYAETWANRMQAGHWGPEAPRRFFRPKHFSGPIRWNRKAAEAGRFDRVMCGSMCDIFEIHGNEETNARMDEMRRRIWDIIPMTENLIWILVTKRPKNIMRLVPWDWRQDFPPNVWVMVTMEDQEAARNRINWVENIPAVVRAVSAEPLVGPIDPRVFRCGRCQGSGLLSTGRALRGLSPCPCCGGNGVSVNWIVAGGETGRQARPMDPAWVEDLRDFSLAYDIPFFFKQWGEWAPANPKLINSRGIYIGDSSRTLRHNEDAALMVRRGKKKTGKAFEGREWTQTPPLRPRHYSDLPE